jgi:hypothetical protein
MIMTRAHFTAARKITASRALARPSRRRASIVFPSCFTTCAQLFLRVASGSRSERFAADPCFTSEILSLPRPPRVL